MDVTFPIGGVQFLTDTQITGAGVSYPTSGATIVAVGPNITGSATFWKPSNLGASLLQWIDVSDGTTVTLNTTNISGLSDKSGNSNTLSQATGANQPAYSVTGINNLPAANFSGASTFLATVSGFTVAQPNTVAVLFQTPSSFNGFDTLWDGSSASTGSREILFADRSDVSNQPTMFATTANVSINGSTLSTTTNYLSVASFNGAASTHGFNGAIPTTLASNPGASGIASGFRWSGGGNHFAGLVGTSVIVNRTLTTSEYNKLCGYMAWRYNLASLLPGNSPYKNRPPYTNDP